MDELVFDVRDYRKRRTIFTKLKLNEKRGDHPELGRIDFIRAVKAAIAEPKEVWPDYGKPSKIHCYYGMYETNIYAKVVVYVKVPFGEPQRVITAYAIDSIKEKRYKGLRRIV